MLEAIITIVSLIFGFVAGWIVQTKFGNKEMQIRLEESGKRLDEEKARMEQIKSEMENTFKALAGDVLKGNTDEFLKLAGEKFHALSEASDKNLDEKKKLIDQNLQEMGSTLKGLSSQTIKLSERLTEAKTATDNLRMVLSSSQKRGQWGERMVEDILRFIGLHENINYAKQKTMETGERPDFTFFLPNEKMLNMDVKFPIAHYEKYVESEMEEVQKNEKNAFLSDVRGHIRTISKRGYINPGAGTLDYVLMFIPNEAIYGFINREDTNLVDYALENHILLCSPLTLYAVLSLIRQAANSFAMEQRAGEVLNLLNEFLEQWKKYLISMDKMGHRIDDAKKEFEHLTTVRSRMIERSLRKIELLNETQEQSLLEE